MKLSILIADGYPPFVQAMKEFLDKDFDLQVVDVANTTDQAVDLALKNEYDMIVLDIAMPGRSGLAALKHIRERKSSLPVLVCCRYPEDQYGALALKAGASGYLAKENIPEKLVTAIQKIINGGLYISDSLQERFEQRT